MKNKFYSLYLLPIYIAVQMGAFSPNVVAAQDSPKVMSSSWTSFKNSSQRLGVATQVNPPLTFPLKVVWKHPVEGKTNGFVDWGPVVANGVVYTSDGLNNVLALDSASGEIVWQKKVISNIFSLTLSEDAKILYVTTAITTKPTATLYAMDAQTGEDLWDNMVNGQPAVGGMEGAPVIANGKIFAAYLQYSGKSGVMAYDCKNGKLFWHWELQRYSPYTPLSYSDGKLYLGYEHKALYAFDAEKGTVLWVKENLGDLPYAAPVIMKNVIYLSTGSNLLALDGKSGNILWQQALEGQTGHSSASVHENLIYIGTQESKLYALSAADGKIVWKSELNKGSIESSPILDVEQGILYIATQGNYLFAVDMKGGQVKSELHLSDDQRGVWKASPAIYGGKLYIGSLDRTFYAVE